ncbi:MAG: SDR family oxidoreductase [Deltaproteobacteria bacterium]|nr:SDR family oxidoreductase [Deltaproteobacteria bacterium]
MTSFLVTGAAGFIGSNLVEALLARGHDVVGLDSFVTGKRGNIAPFSSRMTFIEGDIRDPATCRRACDGVDHVLHEAALGSVPRSVDAPSTTNDHNVTGTLNMLVAARDAKVRRFVYAASSSAYGDTVVLPKVETMAPCPLSPYAVSKYVGELYCGVFHRLYGLPTVALRYFNVFGPRQDPDGMYAAVIPRFAAAILRGERPLIHGDGGQTRDFCFVENVVQANLLACEAKEEALGQVFNIGAAGRISLNALTRRVLELLGSDLAPDHGPPRPGDVRDSQADIGKARRLLGYEPKVDVMQGLAKAIGWYRSQEGS